MTRRVRSAFSRFLDLPDFSAQPNHGSAEKPRFDFRFVRSTASGEPDDSDLQSLVDLSHYNAHIRRANPDLTRDERAGLYSLWFRRNPRTFLFLERAPPDRNGIAVVGNTAILALKQGIFNRVRAGHIAVRNLGVEDICKPDESFDVLLFDTWVIHSDYQDFDRGIFRRRSEKWSHRGYGNGLVLRHLALFWNPVDASSLRLVVEPDAASVRGILERLGFETWGQTIIGEPLLGMSFPPTGSGTPANELPRRYIRDVVKKMQHCSAWALIK